MAAHKPPMPTFYGLASMDQDKALGIIGDHRAWVPADDYQELSDKVRTLKYALETIKRNVPITSREYDVALGALEECGFYPLGGRGGK